MIVHTAMKSEGSWATYDVATFSVDKSSVTDLEEVRQMVKVGEEKMFTGSWKGLSPRNFSAIWTDG